MTPYPKRQLHTTDCCLVEKQKAKVAKSRKRGMECQIARRNANRRCFLLIGSPSQGSNPSTQDINTSGCLVLGE
ncbi:hypothetical protein JTE90_020573 [Oedothorax gibbosus]|uniref:Uncharacterized protein n=1 Tax=Oedothorax gibbosus TaxID=931172 RepID=A0AAV6VZ03_9ARAC|nr:hypothetical protein JTE90_020573 [Oedothorax gibbosus]